MAGMNLTLNDLIQDLEKKASSEEEMKKDDKDAKKSDEEKEGEGVTKDKKDDDKKEGQEKSAAFKSGEDLAKEILEKVASQKTQTEQPNKDTEMNKQAADAGKALAQALMTKLAGVGDANTSTGVEGAPVPNKTQRDLATQVAEHNASFQATPGTDGAGNGGTINQIFDAIVADAQARTGAVVSGQTASAPAEGGINGQTPNQVTVDESREKMAAANSLVESGVDFDTAVAMVKAASDELEKEHDAQVKQAALNELVSQGVDFDLAAAIVKQASAIQAAPAAKAPLSKQAAFNAMIEDGMDFESAVAAVAKL
jgi:hypothetical protein